MKHKWHKEIKAWADGKEIEYQFHKGGDWIPTQCPVWDDNRYEYRIKPQQKYLYVWLDKGNWTLRLDDVTPQVPEDDLYKLIGKIKLESK